MHWTKCWKRQVAHQYSKEWKLNFQREWMKKPEDVKAALEKARWQYAWLVASCEVQWNANGRCSVVDSIVSPASRCPALYGDRLFEEWAQQRRAEGGGAVLQAVP